MAVEQLSEPTAPTGPVSVKKSSKYTVHPAPYPHDAPGYFQFSLTGLIVTILTVPYVLMAWMGMSFGLLYVPVFICTLVPSYVLYMWTDSIVKNWAMNARVKVSKLI